MTTGRAASRGALLLASTALLQGCVWSGYQARMADDALHGRAPGPVVSLQNLRGTNYADVARDAVSAAQRVVAHPEFRREVRSLSLLPTCDGEPRLSGEAVLASLGEAFDYSLVARKPFRAVAVADIGHQRVAVSPSRFSRWPQGVGARAELIETLVHETLHMIPEPPVRKRDGDANGNMDEGEKAYESRYRDDGHGAPGCRDDDLVSYRVGKIAGAVYMLHHDAIDADL